MAVPASVPYRFGFCIFSGGGRYIQTTGGPLGGWRGIGVGLGIGANSDKLLRCKMLCRAACCS